MHDKIKIAESRSCCCTLYNVSFHQLLLRVAHHIIPKGVLLVKRVASVILQEKVINDVLLADQPSKKFVRPEEIGALVRHLCSDDAQSFQGACISIDGGWTAR